jgi:putative transposase
MPRVLLRKGLRFSLNGDQYVIEKRLDTGELQIQHLAEKKYIAVRQEILIEALFDGRLEFDPGSAVKDYKVPKHGPTVESLDLLDDTEENRKRKAEAKRRLKYVKAARKLRISRFTEKRLQPVIVRVSQEIEDKEPPSWHTLGRWCKQYLSQGENPLVLVPRTRARGNRTPKFGFKSGDGTALVGVGKKEKEAERLRKRKLAETVLGMFEEEYEALYLLRERPSVQKLIDRLEVRIRRANKGRAESDQLPIPVDSGIYERVAKKESRETDEYRLGQKESDKKHMAAGREPKPTYPLERVQMDETKLDLMVVDDEMFLPIGRPQIFSQIDVFSGMPPGWFVDFNAPGYLGAMGCMLHAIQPKTYIRERYPEIQHESPCYGLHDTLVIDNAKHYLSDSMEDAADELGFTLDFAPVKMPWFKSHIENFWRIINCELLSYMPGKTFSSLFKRGDYDPKKNAVISFTTFQRILHIYFVDIYPCEIHKMDGFEAVPLQRWMEAIEETPVVLPAKAQDLRVLLGLVLFRKAISQNGVEIDGLFYNSDELREFKDRWVRKRKAGEEIKIKLDPHDISHCYVADSEDGRYIRVPAKNQHYTRNLTRYQHKIIRRRARVIARDYVDDEALCAAKDLIQRIVREEWEKAKAGDNRIKHARFLNYGHEARGERIEQNGKTADTETADKSQSPQEAVGRLYETASSSRGTSEVKSAFPLTVSEEPPTSGQAAPEGGIEKEDSNHDPKAKGRKQSSARSGRQASERPDHTQPIDSDGMDATSNLDDDDLADEEEDTWGGDYGEG